MSRRGVPEGPLGGLGARGARARVAPVDEAAMQAKLRELRSVMAKERTARTEMHSAMEANGGRIWSSSKPTTLRSRDGGLKLRELTAEELERIQRAKDRAAASDRAAAIAAVTAGRARSRSGRRVLDPLDKSVVSASAASRSRPGSASSSAPQTPRAEHVVVRATNAVYAPPVRVSRNAQWAREGAPAAREPAAPVAAPSIAVAKASRVTTDERVRKGFVSPAAVAFYRSPAVALDASTVATHLSPPWYTAPSVPGELWCSVFGCINADCNGDRCIGKRVPGSTENCNCADL